MAFTEFNPADDYAAGTYHWYMGKLYQFTEDHPAGRWTGKDAQIVLEKDLINMLSIVADGDLLHILSQYSNYSAILEIVKQGLAPKVFKIGDQIPTKWSDGTNQYDLPWDVVDFRDVVNAAGHTVPAMILQAHWALPGLQFDASEASFVASSAIAAGKYYIEIGTTWGSHCVKNKKYEFTTTVNIPSGGQIVMTRSGTNQYAWGAPDQAVTNWVVYTFSSNSSTSALEGPLSLTEYGTDETPTGTKIGELNSSQKYSESGMNNLQRAAYGYNRWSQSALRQWLNSDKAASAWWSPKNPFDRPPQQLSAMQGFMKGLPADFLEAVNAIEIGNALNTVTDGDIGTSETTIDRFWCTSLEEEFCEPQLAGVEGPVYPYWKERLGLEAPQASGAANANENHIRYLISNHSSAQYVRLRSAGRGHAYSTWYVYSTGSSNVYNATNAYAPAPACAICSSD